MRARGTAGERGTRADGQGRGAGGEVGGTGGAGRADVSGHAHRHALDAVHEVAAQVVDFAGALEYDVA